MKKIIYYSLLFIALLSSCKINSLVTENNKVVRDIGTNVDSLGIVSSSINSFLENESYTPSFEQLNLSSIDDFYSGIIKSETITNLGGEWRRIELKKNIKSGSKIISKMYIGYFNISQPSHIFISKRPTNFIIDPKSIQNEIIITDTKKIDSLISPKLLTQRIDLYSQKELDFLIAQDRFNFDGFSFKNKRFDYLNFERGSFRGTIFDGCYLDYSTNKRAGYNTYKFDFTKTQIKNSSIKNLNLMYWEFKENLIFKTSFKNSNFSDCKFNKSNFNEVEFENGKFSNNNDGYLNDIKSLKSTFIGCDFDSTKIFSGILWANKFTNCNFRGAEIKWTSIVPYGSTKSRIEVCRFYGGRFHSGNQSQLIIEHPAGYSEFIGVEFSSINWKSSIIKAWFKDSCTFSYGSNLENINWLNSIFENITFNQQSPPVGINMRNSNLSSVDFRQNVVFYNCDFTNSTFPSTSVLQNAGVKFINCIAAPYNS